MSGKTTNAQHHMCEAPIYNVWRAMRQRCLNPNNKYFPYYGGRGIAICDRWSEFSAFLSDMGIPTLGLTLDRVDNNGPYSPLNCRWATRKEQVLNRRNNVRFDIDGEVFTLASAAWRLGLTKEALRGRMRKGWSKARVEDELRSAI